MNPTVIFALLSKLLPHAGQLVQDAQNTIATVDSAQPAHVKAQGVIKDVEDVLSIITGLL